MNIVLPLAGPKRIPAARSAANGEINMNVGPRKWLPLGKMAHCLTLGAKLQPSTAHAAQGVEMSFPQRPSLQDLGTWLKGCR